MVHDPAVVKLRKTGALAAVAALAAGCQGKTDVSEGVANLNAAHLADRGVRLECPDRVDGGEGATFACTLKATRGRASAPVTMRIVEEEGELRIDSDDERAFERAVAKVARS